MSSPQHPISPPPVPASPPQGNTGSGGVRRHHTISAHSRPVRGESRQPLSEEGGEWSGAQEDEYVPPGEEWTASGVGAVGEKNSSLHRQASLPARYTVNRGYQSQAKQSGNSTPLRTMNSLSAIHAEHGIDGEGEEEWEKDLREKDLRGWRPDEESNVVAPVPQAPYKHVVDSSSLSQSSQSPLSPAFTPANVPSPPPAAGAGVRRHVSLTYGATHSGNASIKRSGTLAGVKPRRNNTIGLGGDVTQGSSGRGPESPSPPEVEEDFVEEDPEEEEYYQQQFQAPQQAQPQGYMGSPISKSPWSTAGREWRGGNMMGGASNAAYGSNNGATMDDVQRALSALELSSSGASPRGASQILQMNNVSGQAQGGPPRFNNQTSPGLRGPPSGNGSRSADLRLVTDFNAQMNAAAMYQGNQQQQNAGNQGYQGPFGASSYVPPIGHGAPGQQGSNRGSGPSGGGGPGGRPGPGNDQGQGGTGHADDRAATASGTMWDQKDPTLNRRSSNPSLQYQNQQGNQGNQGWNNGGGPPVPTIPAQYLQPQPQAPRLGAVTNYGGGLSPQAGNAGGQATNNQGPQGYVGSPIDVPSLIATKGYNPTNFEIRPSFARFFVIKSYTEDDVHKSLKYEIWSSTDPGNKRLDKAFKECAGRGPIYLFFSVNASGHFCGMAEMLTPVDYTRSSTVWASDKWKGVFKVRWIFVRDIPNANLRHIRLNNTQERKPVTNSRDTQELLPEAGHEMLRIFFTYPARTSLLQDFAFYELQAIQRITPQQPSPSSSPQPQGAQSPQQPFAMPNQNSAPYGVGQQMGPPVSMLQGQYMQSVMRQPSPVPSGGYAMPNQPGSY